MREIVCLKEFERERVWERESVCVRERENILFLPEFKQDVCIEEEDGSVVEDGAVGGEPGRGRDEGGRVVFPDVLVVIGGVEPKINIK